MFLFVVYWVQHDEQGLFLSDAAHLYNARCHYLCLQKFDIQSFMLVRELYPNLFHQLTAIITFISRDAVTSTAVLNAFFVIISMWGAFFLGSLLADKRAGFISALIIPAFSGISHFLFINNIDITLGAFVIWSFYFLIKSDGFENRGYSICFWIVFLLGMLVKWAMLFFLLVPLVWVAAGIFRKCGRVDETGRFFSKIWFIISIILVFAAYFGLAFYTKTLGRDELGYPPVDSFWVLLVVTVISGLLVAAGLQFFNRKRQDPAVNFISGLILSLALTAHYYLYSFHFLVNTYLGRFWGGPELQKHASQHNPWYFLVKSFILDFTGIPVFVLLAAGVVFYVFSKNKNKDFIPLLAGILSSLVILALQPIYDTRYFLPLAGLLSIFCALPVSKIGIKSLRIAIIVLVAVFSVISITGRAFLPAKYSAFMGSYVKDGSENIAEVKNLTNTVIRDMRANPDKQRRLVMFFDNSGNAGFKPLVIMYLLSAGLNPNEKIYLFPEGVDLRKSSPGVPLMYYIIPEADDNAGEEPVDADTDKDDSGDGSSHDAGWDDVNPQTFYLVYSDKSCNPADISQFLNKFCKKGWLPDFSKENSDVKNILETKEFKVLKWQAAIR
jgi:4-amino-4-deoxy-L-arabinose transferase-like glycosyltransferase